MSTPVLPSHGSHMELSMLEDRASSSGYTWLGLDCEMKGLDVVPTGQPGKKGRSSSPLCPKLVSRIEAGLLDLPQFLMSELPTVNPTGLNRILLESANSWSPRRSPCTSISYPCCQRGQPGFWPGRSPQPEGNNTPFSCEPSHRVCWRGLVPSRTSMVTSLQGEDIMCGCSVALWEKWPMTMRWHSRSKL